MFCPKCGSKNLEDAKFCRACGVDISLVPEAITGQISKKQAGLLDVAQAPMTLDWGSLNCGTSEKRVKRPSLEKAVTNIFMGLAFLLVAPAILIFGPGGRVWWFWMLIPAFALLGAGVAEIIRLRQTQRATPRPDSTIVGAPTAAFAPAPPANELQPRRNTSEIYAPPASVTESTTRHLDQHSAREFEKVPAARPRENL